MGISGISMGSLLIILLIVMLLFGTKRLRSIGTDLGAALRSFRQSMAEGNTDKGSADESESARPLDQDKDVG
ncbi:MAG: twin-arginine translocase TatA/TatE family subunit [Gammaproteobacteria bacterium]